MPDRFTEEEARRVFARAAERQHAAEAAPAGLSRAELEEIGRAAGLDPSNIAVAIAEVRAGVPDVARTAVWGIDLEPEATRVIPVEVTDEAWEQIVGRLRQTFKTRGTPTDVGRVREWTGANGQGGSSNLHATVEPVEGGTRLTVGTSKAYEASGMRTVPWMFGVMTVLFAVFVGVGDFPPGIWSLPVSIGVLGVAITAGLWVGFTRWSQNRQAQFDALLDQVELIARSSAVTASGSAAASERPEARLDLDGLDPEAEGAPRESRRRMRS